MGTTEDPGSQPRAHPEMPAEGGPPQQQPAESGGHPQAPAEGADPGQGQARDASNENASEDTGEDPAAGKPD
jgi:hypothetical protein